MVAIAVPLFRRGQSYETIWATHADELPVCVRSACSYQERDRRALPASPAKGPYDLCQDFGHGIERNHAAIGIASGLGSGRSKKASLGSVRSKKSAMASAGTL